MSAKEARDKLGKPEEKGEAMDFYVFSGRERARETNEPAFNGGRSVVVF